MASHVRNFAFWKANQSFFKPDSVIVITGAGSGIGQAVSYIYAARRCRLVLADINKTALDVTAARVRDLGSICTSVQVDVTDEKQCQSLMQQTIKLYGGIDILVLCAGIGAHHTFSSTADLSIFRKCMEINFYGYLYCIHAAHAALVASRGLLVAVTSFSGEVGLPYRTAYCSSKFAVTGLLESLRSEMKLREKESKQGQLNAESGSYDITIVCPPTVNTNLRKNSLTTDQSLKSNATEDAMSVDDCARAIVDAADRRLRKAFFPFNSWIASYLRPLLPDAMDALIHKKAKL